MVGSVIEPSGEALFPTCRSGFSINFPGHFLQLCAAACGDGTDKGCKGGKMLGLGAFHVGHEFLQGAQNRSEGFLCCKTCTDLLYSRTAQYLKTKDVGDMVKVSIVMQQIGFMLNAYGCDHAIDRIPYGDPT